jgi:hypothetical protein
MSDIGAVMKLTESTPFGPPGPMVGFHGRIRPTLKPDPALQASLHQALAGAETLLKNAAVPGLPTSVEPFCFAVVDLTNDPRTPGFGPLTPAYAGHNDTRTVSIASLCKLLPLYAAHQLRSDARALASVTAPTTLAQLGDLVRQHHRRFGAADEVFPLVEDILDFRADGVVDFMTGGTRWPAQASLITPLQLDAVDRPELPGAGPTPARVAAVEGNLDDSNPQAVRTTVQGQLRDIAFREQLRLMAGWSNNVSASLVAQAIGFPYLWQLARRSGLFRHKAWPKLLSSGLGKPEPGGMFLGLDYAGNFWTKRPRGARGAPVLHERPSQSGNARSVAQLMASLAGELIDDEAHISMREMLRKTKDFRGLLNSPDLMAPLVTVMEDSPIGMGMAAKPPGWSPVQAAWDFGPIPSAPDPTRDQLVNGKLAVSKVGLLPKPGLLVSSNAVLVRAVRGTSAAPVVVTSVLVGLVNLSELPAGLAFGDLAAVAGAFGRAMAVQLDLRHP